MANIDRAMTCEEEGAACIRISEVLNMYSVPMALQAAAKLNVMEILASSERELSAEDIVARMQAQYQLSISNPTAHISLDCILRVLASQCLLSSSVHERPDGQLPVRKYGSTAVCRYLAGKGYLISSMPQLKPFTDSWQFLDQTVLQGTDAFTLAHGKPAFLYGQEHPDFVNLFNLWLANRVNLFMPILLHSYPGFHDVNTLVDVGGNVGTCLSAIVSHYPHIKGINFDLPHIVATAPAYSGVEHIGGDMFKSIPQGDAIFLRNILHNWSDESCVEILKTCYKALPKNGKVIVVDIILSPTVENTSISRLQATLNLAMHAFFNGGKERTQQELQGIVNAAGFEKMRLVTQVDSNSVIELHKD